MERTGLPEEVIERLIRTGALDSLGPAAARAPVAAPRGGRRVTRPGGRAGAARAGPRGRQAVRGGRATDGPAAARDRRPGTPRDHRVGADRRCLRGHRARCPAPGRDALPAGAGAARRGDQRGARRTTVGPGPDRRAGRHPPAPDDGQGHGLPGPRGRDRDGQRHALARHLGASAGRRPPARPAAGGRGAPAGGRGGQRDRPRRSGHSPRWPPRPAARIGRPASASSGMPGCDGWGDRRIRGLSRPAAGNRRPACPRD